MSNIRCAKYSVVNCSEEPSLKAEIHEIYCLEAQASKDCQICPDAYLLIFLMEIKLFGLNQVHVAHSPTASSDFCFIYNTLGIRKFNFSELSHCTLLKQNLMQKINIINKLVFLWIKQEFIPSSKITCPCSQEMVPSSKAVEIFEPQEPVFLLLSLLHRRAAWFTYGNTVGAALHRPVKNGDGFQGCQKDI